MSFVVVDLGFGDAGKGTITDHLVRQHDIGLVVRFNGGAQAGHNVVTDDGRHHTFSQWGAGTFAGARTLLGPDVLVHPGALVHEARHLVQVGIPDPFSRLSVDRRARLITPFQQAHNQLLERARGDAAHGTCGVGVGECVRESLEHPERTLHAQDLADPARLRRLLTDQREAHHSELSALGIDPGPLFEDAGLIDRVLDSWAALARVLPRVDSPAVLAGEAVVFEGAQGVLLDETWGFHPHTTWSDTTAAGAHSLCEGPLTVVGVTRAYQTRHGAGPLPTEGTLTLEEAHNSCEGWQGAFRTGALDGVLLRYALAVCPVDTLAVTCLDRVDPTHAPVCVAYQDGHARITDLHPGAPERLEHREALGRWLGTVAPVLVGKPVVPWLTEHTGLPVLVESHGPRPGDKR